MKLVIESSEDIESINIVFKPKDSSNTKTFTTTLSIVTGKH